MKIVLSYRNAIALQDPLDFEEYWIILENAITITTHEKTTTTTKRNNPPRLIFDCNLKYKVRSCEPVLERMTEYVNKPERIADYRAGGAWRFCVNVCPRGHEHSSPP